MMKLLQKLFTPNQPAPTDHQDKINHLELLAGSISDIGYSVIAWIAGIVLLFAILQAWGWWKKITIPLDGLVENRFTSAPDLVEHRSVGGRLRWSAWADRTAAPTPPHRLLGDVPDSGSQSDPLDRGRDAGLNHFGPRP